MILSAINKERFLTFLKIGTFFFLLKKDFLPFLQNLQESGNRDSLKQRSIIISTKAIEDCDLDLLMALMATDGLNVPLHQAPGLSRIQTT